MMAASAHQDQIIVSMFWCVLDHLILCTNGQMWKNLLLDILHIIRKQVEHWSCKTLLEPLDRLNEIGDCGWFSIGFCIVRKISSTDVDGNRICRNVGVDCQIGRIQNIGIYFEECAVIMVHLWDFLKVSAQEDGCHLINPTRIAQLGILSVVNKQRSVYAALPSGGCLEIKLGERLEKIEVPRMTAFAVFGVSKEREVIFDRETLGPQILSHQVLLHLRAYSAIHFDYYHRMGDM